MADIIMKRIKRFEDVRKFNYLFENPDFEAKDSKEDS